MRASLLDSRSKIAKYDSENLLGSVEHLPDQLEYAWKSKTKLPATYKKTARIVVCGMGGSALPADVVASLFSDRLSVPVDVVRDYSLPKWADRNTLVIACSYSGNTEETLSAVREASARKAKIAVIAGGGELLKTAKARRWPLLTLTSESNPSNQPRMAIGSFTAALMTILQSHGGLRVADKEMNGLIEFLRTQMKQFAPETKSNPAKNLAEHLYGKMAIFVGAEHMRGAAHVITNQVNENAKHLAVRLELPELNHHFLEALRFPERAKRSMTMILFQSAFYHEQNQKRVQLTADVLARHGIEAQIVSSDAPGKLEQAWEAIHLGSYASFYLAMRYKIDPAPVPTVEWFKHHLKTYGE